MARALLVLCVCVCVQIVYCQFGFFNPDERQAFNFAKGLGNFRETIGGVLRPHRRRITNDQSGQNFQQRPVSFPTAYPEESPNSGAQGEQGSQGNQVNTQSPFPEGQGNIVNDGNQNQHETQGNVNIVNDGNHSQGQDFQPGQGNINIVNNDGSSPGMYDGPNDSVTFEKYDTTQGPVVTPETESRNNFNFETAPDCLKLYLNGENIPGWNCPKCKDKRDAIKKLDISRLPPVLVIHFKRFYVDPKEYMCNSYRKRQTYIDFPLEDLDMRQFSINCPGNSQYNLYAVSNHYGSMEGGHYTAYCKSSVYGKWYKYDDHVVSEISPSEVKSSAAYILFYTSVPRAS